MVKNRLARRLGLAAVFAAVLAPLSWIGAHYLPVLHWDPGVLPVAEEVARARGLSWLRPVRVKETDAKRDAAGWYDRAWRTVYLRRDAVRHEQDRSDVTFHELVHAMEYQHFLPEITVLYRDNDFIGHCLLEGDADLLSARRAFSRDDIDLTYVKKSSGYDRLWYQWGTRFAAVRFRSGGTAALDEAFSTPPADLDEIEHPQRYLRRFQEGWRGEDPGHFSSDRLGIAVSLPDGWQRTASGVFELDAAADVDNAAPQLSYVFVPDNRGRVAVDDVASETAWTFNIENEVEAVIPTQYANGAWGPGQEGVFKSAGFRIHLLAYSACDDQARDVFVEVSRGPRKNDDTSFLAFIKAARRADDRPVCKEVHDAVGLGK